MKREPKGPDAAKWRKKKFDALRKHPIPEDLLPGSLTQSKLRCRKSTCHCAQGEGHPSWTLTFMSEGKKRIEHIPFELVDEVRRRVEAGRTFKDALGDVMSANAELLVLERRQQREREKRTKQRKRNL